MAYTTIDDPSAYFQTTLYTGDGGGTRAVTHGGNSDLNADWVWIKDRGTSSTHYIFDSVRGVQKHLSSASNSQELSDANSLKAFNSNSFTLGTSGNVNGNSRTFVSWNWKAGTSFTNDASSTGIGDIDSDGSVSATAGFSIAKFTTTGSSVQTVAHGLGSIPDMYIVKGRANGTSWFVYHKDIGNTHYLKLNASEAKTDNPMWGDTSPTSTVFSINPDNFGATTSIGYFFKSIKGYSKFGSYVGNGNADGTFVYTGFKPAFVLLKHSSGGTDNWNLYDNKRLGYNANYSFLIPNESNAENTGATTAPLDLLSNGFKIRASTGHSNSSGETYIYMAFAKNPFTSSTGTPVTAR